MQRAAHGGRPLAHRVQPKVARVGAVSVEATAVILNPQNHLGTNLVERQLGALRTGM